MILELISKDDTIITTWILSNSLTFPIDEFKQAIERIVEQFNE